MHLVGFIIRYITMHDPLNVKLAYLLSCLFHLSQKNCHPWNYQNNKTVKLLHMLTPQVRFVLRSFSVLVRPLQGTLHIHQM